MTALLVTLSCALALGAPVETPRVVDSRLKLELFTAEPDLVTPTGIAVDAQGRVLVIECHTHFRPKDYQGPPADRIRRFEDTDGDGKADRITTFFEGTQSTMNLAVFRDGSVYVATRSELFRLRDNDNDGAAEERTTLVRLETSGNYPHNGLSGFAFDFADHVYFGMGENLGVEFKLIGSDGSSIAGREGGHVFRCDRDGKNLVRYATGFWNPFHVALDVYERLFALDNDPDSLPPCRLLHVVEGGNYGYKFRNGRKGLHPFTAWNGELPGTLPMVAGTGEAPSGLVAYESDNLPDDYLGDLLVTSWGDHRIEQYDLKALGASFTSQMQPVVVGGENFRPVGIALAPDGSLYISDWVDKSYPIHGKGRIWRLSAAESKQPERPDDPKLAIHSGHRPLREWAARELLKSSEGIAELWSVAKSTDDEGVQSLALLALDTVKKSDIPYPILSDGVKAVLARQGVVKSELPEEPAEVRAEVLRHLRDAEDVLSLGQEVNDPDPFIAQAARLSLHALNELPDSPLAAALLWRERSGLPPREQFDAWLEDPNPLVRFVAVQWIGEEKLTDYKADLPRVLSAGPLTERLFGAYLAAQERLDGSDRKPKDEWAGEQYVLQALNDEKTPSEARALALRMLRPDHPSLTLGALQRFMAKDNSELRLEAVRTLRDSPLADKTEVLLHAASDTAQSTAFRLDAVAGLTPEKPDALQFLLEQAAGDDGAFRNEALRSLRGATLDEGQRRQLAKLAEDRPAAAELVRKVLDPAAPPIERPTPEELDVWMSLLDGPGDPAAGERIFYHAKSAACSRCHQMSGRGGRVGPDLTMTARKLTRERLIDSIVRPSKEIAPMFVPWTIETVDGRVLAGMIVSEAVNGELTFSNEKAELFRLKPAEIEARHPSQKSIMPDSLANSLTVQEFKDLLAFLLGE